MRLRITAAAETIVRGGHPWVFAASVREQNRPGDTGELAVIYDRNDRFLAIGLYDAESPLRVRVLHAGKPATLDDTWWRARLDAALGKRRGMFDERTTGFRWINGESDGWPGLVLDRYGDVLVMKLYTAAWFPHFKQTLKLFHAVLNPASLVLRLSRNIQEIAGEKFQLRDGEVVSGEALKENPIFLENGVRFEADVVRGQKTGFFLDQRENRQRIETFARGAHVLNAFSFSSGFSLYAARGGATSVTDVDISAHALESGARNFALNHDDRNVSACRRHAVQADVFAWLDQNTSRRFDVVILDPPSLAKRESERAGAIEAYVRLVKGGIGMLAPKGILAAASCSAHVSADEFFDAVRRTARASGRRFEELGTTGHAPDHAATFREAQYLKCIYLRG